MDKTDVLLAIGSFLCWLVVGAGLFGVFMWAWIKNNEYWRKRGYGPQG